MLCVGRIDILSLNNINIKGKISTWTPPQNTYLHPPGQHLGQHIGHYCAIIPPLYSIALQSQEYGNNAQKA